MLAAGFVETLIDFDSGSRSYGTDFGSGMDFGSGTEFGSGLGIVGTPCAAVGKDYLIGAWRNIAAGECYRVETH